MRSLENVPANTILRVVVASFVTLELKDVDGRRVDPEVLPIEPLLFCFFGVNSQGLHILGHPRRVPVFDVKWRLAIMLISFPILSLAGLTIITFV